MLASEAFARSLLPDDPRWDTADAFVAPPFSPPSESASRTIFESGEDARSSQSLDASSLGRSGGPRRSGPQALETALKRSLRQPSFLAAENANARRSLELGSAGGSGRNAPAGSPGSFRVASRSPGWVRRVVSLPLLGLSTGAVVRKGPAFRLVAAPELVLKGVGPSTTFLVDLDQWHAMPVALPDDSSLW